VCGQGIPATSFTLCMLSPVRIVTWQSECIAWWASVLPDGCDLNLLNGSQTNLLDSAKSLVTKFQLKPAKSIEFVYKICYFFDD